MKPGRVNRPWPVPVQAGADGTPRTVGRLAVRSVREEWLVEDGSDVVVFRDPGEDRWYRQRD